MRRPLFIHGPWPRAWADLTWLRVADVGDGLCCAIGRSWRPDAVIDCGGSSGPQALDKFTDFVEPYLPGGLERLVLTHVHRDHYVALIEAARRGVQVEVKELVLPRIPDFPQASAFRVALRAMEARFALTQIGIGLYDARQWLARINRVPFATRYVKEGDSIPVGRRRLRVLWPPQQVVEGEISGTVTNALHVFEEALSADPVLKAEHEHERSREPESEESEVAEVTLGEGRGEPRDTPPGPIPEATVAADRALRRAANRLSLAVHLGTDLLLWGDQEDEEIRAVCRNLDRHDLTHFNVMLTPHHGTHWPPDRATGLASVLALTSAGPRRIGSFRKGAIPAEMHCATFLEGDLVTDCGWW